MGITFTTFRKSENISLSKDTLIILLHGTESSVFNSFNTFVIILLGPIALFDWIQLVGGSMSAGDVQEKKIVSSIKSEGITYSHLLLKERESQLIWQIHIYFSDVSDVFLQSIFKL